MPASKDNSIYEKTSFLSKSNSAFIESMYLKYISNSPQLPQGWKEFFDGLGEEKKYILNEIEGPSWAPNKINIKKELSRYFFEDIQKNAKKFNQKIISVDEMSDIFSSTEFMPCPNGFFHPETYRLYEALECECIPIVESAYNYYDRLFPGNPFIKINKWSDAKPILKGWDLDQIKQKKEQLKIWWNKYKEELQEFIKNKITA